MLESPVLLVPLSVVVPASVLGPCVGLVIWAIAHSRKHGGLESILGLVFGLFLGDGDCHLVDAGGTLPDALSKRRTSWVEHMATPVYVLLGLPALV